MKYYPAKYISSQYDATGVPFDLWHFVSEKSRRKYNVLVEQYQEHTYAVKFYPRAWKNDVMRYSKLTGDGEPRTIVLTIIHIMLHYAREDSKSSFLFFGSASEGECETNTKRFRFYSRIMREYFDSTTFVHKDNIAKSLYMMLRRTEMESGELQESDIIEFIDTQYE